MPTDRKFLPHVLRAAAGYTTSLHIAAVLPGYVASIPQRSAYQPLDKEFDH